MRERTPRREQIKDVLSGAHQTAQASGGKRNDPKPGGNSFGDINVDSGGVVVIDGNYVARPGRTDASQSEDSAEWRAQMQAQLNANSRTLKEILNTVATPPAYSQSIRRKRRFSASFSNQTQNARSRPAHQHSIIASTAKDARGPISFRLAYTTWRTLGRAQARLDTYAAHITRTTENARHTTVSALSRIITAPTRCANAIHKKAANAAAQFQSSFFLPATNSANSIPTHTAQFHHIPHSQTPRPRTAIDASAMNEPIC